MKYKYDDTIIIIGAGIAGLAAGCYAQMNGYQTQIFEMHDRPGWKGSSCGWLLTKQTLPLSIKELPKTLPKLRNFYSLA